MSETMNYLMYLPTRILFGAGSLSLLGQQKLPGKRALIVTTNGKSVFRNGAYDKTVEQLTQAGIESVLFNQVVANPLRSTVMNGAAVAREFECDLVVAIGGGSVMDAAKAIACMAVNDGDIWDYISHGTGKALTLERNPLPVICITTTAGTGSEVNRFAVVSHDELEEKLMLDSIEETFPLLSVVDPELMTSLPPKLTAYQGFDALFHAIECYLSRDANCMTDILALASLERAARYLPEAVNNGDSIEARSNMAFANILAGMNVNMCCPISAHAIEHAMSAVHHALPHGAGLIMISRAFYLHLIRHGSCPERFITMAKVMGITEASIPDAFIDALDELLKKCGVESLKMSEYGFEEKEFDCIIRNAFETQSILLNANPIKLSYEDCYRILADSYK